MISLKNCWVSFKQQSLTHSGAMLKFCLSFCQNIFLSAFLPIYDFWLNLSAISNFSYKCKGCDHTVTCDVDDACMTK